MKKLSLDDFTTLKRIVCRNARPLEFTMWKYAFENGSQEDMLSVLACYQNEDGGFGHNLECNCWNPNSSPAIGWVGMNGVPSNDDYSHAPWFAYDPQASTDGEPGTTRTLTEFILKYAESDSALYKKAVRLAELVKKADNASPDFSEYDPEQYRPWMADPLTFVNSPDSVHYPVYKELVDRGLDVMVDRLHNTKKIENTLYFDADHEQIVGCYWWAPSDYISQIELLKKFGRLDFQLPIQE
ncbi:MAG: hypothetical protein LBI03_02715 [Clostridiales bacterium]|nr:hypothetical protein [Clostridiales bacterium]